MKLKTNKLIIFLTLFLSFALIQPSIIYFIWSALKVIIALGISIPLALFISAKVISYAIKKYPQIKKRRSDENKTNTEKNTKFWTKFFAFLQSLSDVFLLSIAQSPAVQLLVLNKEMDKVVTSEIYSAIKPLGEVPKRAMQSPSSIVCVSPNVDNLMMQIFEYTYRDYVETWYKEVSCDHGRLHKLLKSDFLKVYRNFADRLSNVDVINLFMDRFMNILSKHFEEIEAAKTTRRSSDTEDNCKSFDLHPCLRDSDSELQFLRRICDYILILTLPVEDLKNSSLRIILREVLAGLALLPMVQTLCDPDYINQCFVQYLKTRDRDGLQETRTYMYAESYEKFITFINDCKDITVLQKIRYQIMTEVMQATTISSLKKEGFKKGAKSRQMAKGDLLISRDLKRYINQCQIAKQHCERRIKTLGGSEYGSRVSSPEGLESKTVSHVQLLSFSEVMNSPMVQSYFLRYLKKQGKGQFLKFWNEVEMIESTDSTGKELARLVTHAYQTYIINGSAEQLPITIDKTVTKGMQECVIGDKSPEDFYTVQKQVYEVLEKEYYPSFVVSDIYTRQLMPELVEPDSDMTFSSRSSSRTESQESLNTATAFGKAPSDDLLQQLQLIESKLEYKAQALESLKPTAKLDQKVTQQLEHDISSLQREKLRLQLSMERTEFWWGKIGQWSATIDHAEVNEVTEGCFEPVYTITVQCSDVPIYDVTDGVSGWIVGRTLSEFKVLHQSLKKLQPWVKSMSIPKTSLFGLRKATDKFLSDSKNELNIYLDKVLKDKVLCCTEVVYGFLGQIDDVEEKQAEGKWQLGGFLKGLPRDFIDFLRPSDEETENEVDDSEDRKDSIATPLYELISEVFELRGVFRPLRHTLIVFVRLAFGGSINKQIVDTVDWLVSEPMILYYLQSFCDSMWPGGKLAAKHVTRNDEEQRATLLDARVKLLENIPDVLSSLMGQENARRGCVKIFVALQDKRLNKHLFYTILSETMEEVFPEILKNL